MRTCTMPRLATSLLLATMTIAACESHQPAPPRVAIADLDHAHSINDFNALYRNSRFSQWNLRASAAGSRCDVLFVRTAVFLDEPMIEALHYGAITYDLYEGGVQQFSRDRAFRGVTYKDPSGRLWAYGAVSVREAEGLAPCTRPQ
jgi:hypothetical protein